MKAIKTIKKISTIMYNTYSKLFNTIFDVLFGSFITTSMIDMYCNEHYYMNSDGIIMREESF